MKRWMIYLAAVAAALILRPKEIKDVGGLLPVELLYVSSEAGKIRVETDTGNLGQGNDLAGALSDLKATAPGEIFLETADYLIVTRETVDLLPELAAVLRPAAEVCIGIGADAQAAEYWKAHPSGCTMKDIRAGQQEIPMLIGEKEQYRFGQMWKFGETA